MQDTNKYTYIVDRHTNSTRTQRHWTLISSERKKNIREKQTTNVKPSILYKLDMMDCTRTYAYAYLCIVYIFFVVALLNFFHLSFFHLLLVEIICIFEIFFWSPFDVCCCCWCVISFVWCSMHIFRCCTRMYYEVVCSMICHRHR